MKALDQQGLAYFWAKLKARLAPDYSATAVKMPYNWINGHAIYRQVITLIPSQMAETREAQSDGTTTYQYTAEAALRGVDTILPMTCAMLYLSNGHTMPMAYVRNYEHYDAGYGFLHGAYGPTYNINLFTGQRPAAEIARVTMIVYYTSV